jgi:WD40 repeat protein
MTLMLGPQVLANVASLHDAGVVDGAMLCIIYAPIYKLLVCTAAGGLELWNQEGKREGIFLDPRARTFHFQGAEFSPGGTFVLTIDDHTAWLWRVDTQEKCPFHFYHVGYLASATFSPTGTTVLSACVANEVKLWSVSSGQCVKQLEIGYFGDVITAFTASGAVALHTHDGRIALWNVETGDRVWEYRVDCTSGAGEKGFSSCGDWFFSIHGRGHSDYAHALDVWRVSGRSHYRRLEKESRKIDHAAFSSDGWRVLTVSVCRAITVWSLRHDWAAFTLIHEDEIDSVAFSPDGVQVISVSHGWACLWTADAQGPQYDFPQDDVHRALFAPDGKCLLLSGADGIAMWSTEGACCWTADNIVGVSFSSSRASGRLWTARIV